jgi:uncharacterized C2H2 Zn-finger protein
MVGVQAPVHEKNAVCTKCGNVFTNQSNLNRHMESTHTDQNTPEAVAKRLKLKDYRNNTRRERRANDPVYREKQRQISHLNRMNKKACQVADDGAHMGGVSNDVKAKDESIAFETEKKDEVEKKGDGVWTPTDVVHTLQHLPATPMIVGLSTDVNASSISINEPSTVEAEIIGQLREENVHLRKMIVDITHAHEVKVQKIYFDFMMDHANDTESDSDYDTAPKTKRNAYAMGGDEMGGSKKSKK